MNRPLSERSVLLLLGSVQFVNVLDFMMIMPLGPDLAAAFHVANSKLGMMGASYTFAAALAGILGSGMLDRFDRRKALTVALAGLVLSTAAGGFVTSFPAMLVTRCVAGTFGGPASALALAIVSDIVPPERRGQAMGKVLGAFAVASVLGVPAGLELAHLGGFRLPFFAVAALGVVVTAGALISLPPLTGHLERLGRHRSTFLELIRRPGVAVALSCNGLVMFGHFALVPNLAAYFQFNFGFPRDGLGFLYFVGGTISFATMRLAGLLADRFGAPLIAAGATVGYIAILVASFIAPQYQLPVVVLFAGFMITSSFRAVPMRALASRVPNADERARYMSSQSAVDHLAGAAGALLGARLLHELPDGKLQGMDRLAWVTLGVSLIVPYLLLLVDRRVREREQASPASPLLSAEPRPE
jgi:predicted MFS family arabinose efflux permease